MTLIYQEIKRRQRPWGYEVRLLIKDGSRDVETCTPYWATDPTAGQVDTWAAAYIAKLQDRLDWEAIRSTVFDDIGPEIKAAVFWLIRKIREYPGATLLQAENAWDAEWADSLFEFDRLAAWVRNLAGNITWDQFKTYVINHNFEGID